MCNYIAVSIVSLFAICLLVTGCGGADDSADAEQIDKVTFVKQANQICEQVSGKMVAKFTSISKQASASPNPSFTGAQIRIVKEALIPGLEEEQEQIRALGQPTEATRETKALLEAYRQAIEKTKANPKIGLRNVPPYEPIELAGARFGVSECPIAPVRAG